MKKCVSIFLLAATFVVPVQLFGRVKLDISLPLHAFDISRNDTVQGPTFEELLTDPSISESVFQVGIQKHIDDLIEIIAQYVASEHENSSPQARKDAIDEAQATFLDDMLTILFEAEQTLIENKEAALNLGDTQSVGELDKIIGRVAYTQKIVKQKQSDLGLLPVPSAPPQVPWYKQYAPFLIAGGVSIGLIAATVCARIVWKRRKRNKKLLNTDDVKWTFTETALCDLRDNVRALSNDIAQAHEKLEKNDDIELVDVTGFENLDGDALTQLVKDLRAVQQKITERASKEAVDEDDDESDSVDSERDGDTAHPVTENSNS